MLTVITLSIFPLVLYCHLHSFSIQVCSFIPSRTWFLSSAPNKLNCNGQNVSYYFNERVFLIVAKFMTSLQGGS